MSILVQNCPREQALKNHVSPSRKTIDPTLLSPLFPSPPPSWTNRLPSQFPVLLLVKSCQNNTMPPALLTHNPLQSFNPFFCCFISHQLSKDGVGMGWWGFMTGHIDSRKSIRRDGTSHCPRSSLRFCTNLKFSFRISFESMRKHVNVKLFLPSFSKFFFRRKPQSPQAVQRRSMAWQ